MNRIVVALIAVGMLVGSLPSYAGKTSGYSSTTTSTNKSTMTTANDANIDKVIEVTRAVLASDKKAIVAKNMNLTDTESTNFWKLYREYQFDLSKVTDRRVAVLKEYANSYETLTDPQAKKLLNESLKIQGQRLDLMKRYTKRFSKVLPDKKVARFFQLENKINAVIDVNLAQDVPLAK